MTKEKPFSATFKLEIETKNTVRYAEEAEAIGRSWAWCISTSMSCPSPFPRKFGSRLSLRNRTIHEPVVLRG